MKTLRYVIVVLLLLPSASLIGGCWLHDDRSSLSDGFEYAGHRYEFFNYFYWHVIDKDDYILDTVVLQGEEFTIRVYNDPQIRFIGNGAYGFYHRVDDSLPDCWNIQSVESIRLYLDEETPEVVVDKEFEIAELIEFLRPPDDEVKNKSNNSEYTSRLKSGIADVYIYCKDYPACLLIGTIWQTESGLYQLQIYRQPDPNARGWADWVAIPLNSSLLQYLQ